MHAHGDLGLGVEAHLHGVRRGARAVDRVKDLPHEGLVLGREPLEQPAAVAGEEQAH